MSTSTTYEQQQVFRSSEYQHIKLKHHYSTMARYDDEAHASYFDPLTRRIPPRITTYENLRPLQRKPSVTLRDKARKVPGSYYVPRAYGVSLGII